jgi:hypothetical protein
MGVCNDIVEPSSYIVTGRDELLRILDRVIGFIGAAITIAFDYNHL